MKRRSTWRCEKAEEHIISTLTLADVASISGCSQQRSCMKNQQLLAEVSGTNLQHSHWMHT